jgi:L-ascorbate metabolism protein UlaG (beta-lactamase superfamily)
MNLHFLRHATFIFTYHSQKLLVDPMLSAAGAMDPVGNAADTRRIPLVELPVSEDELTRLLDQVDAVLVTHIHRDHWDAKAVDLLSKQLPILCQPADVNKIREAGFANVTAVDPELEWNGILFNRTGGQHGTGEIGKLMGTVSGFVLSAEGEPTLYIAGDTIWCTEVAEALTTYKPQRIILNAGAAQFLVGDPITMTIADVKQVCMAARTAQVVAVHMDAVNHCGLTQAALKHDLLTTGFAEQVWVPADGSQMDL